MTDLDPAAFQGVAGTVVDAIDPHTEADRAGLLATFLAMAGNAAGRGPHAVADGAQHPAKLNVLLVGATSRSRKGSSFAQVRRVMQHADEGWTHHRIAGGVGSGEGIILEVSDRDDEEQTDKRLLVHESEFGRLLAAASRDGSTVSHIIREAWDSDRLRVLTRRDPLVATGAYISVVGHITAEELKAKLTSTDVANGFANRFLFVAVDRSKLLPSGGNADDEMYVDLGGKVRKRLEDFRRIVRFVRTPVAEERWEELYAEIAHDTPGGLIGALTARAEAQVLRLSVAYAGLDGSNKIDLPHLEAAWALWRYCDASIRHLFSSATGNPDADRILERLREEVRKYGANQGLDASDLYGLFSGHRSRAEIDAARTLLVDRGDAEIVTVRTAGRPREVLFLACEESEEGEVSPRAACATCGIPTDSTWYCDACGETKRALAAEALE